MADSFNVDEFLSNMTEGLDLADDQKTQLKGMLEGNQGFQSRVRDGWLRQSDYSRNMDRLREEQTKLDAELDRTRKFFEEQQTQAYNNREEYLKVVAERDRLAAGSPAGELTGYEDIYGEPSEPTPQASTGEIEAKLQSLREAYQKDLAQTQTNVANLVAETTRLSQQHSAEFGEALDVGTLMNFAVEKQLPLESAYREFTRGQRTELVSEKHQAELVAARKEGEVAALSKHHLPVASRPRGIHALKPPQNQPKDQQGRVNAAVEDFMKAGQ